MVARQTTPQTHIYPSSADLAGDLCQLADLVDSLINTITSAQALHEPTSRGLRAAAALARVLEHPAMDNVTAWLAEETARGNDSTPRIAALLECSIEHAHAIVERDNANARPSLLVLTSSDVQREVNQLAAFATPLIQILRRQAQQLAQPVSRASTSGAPAAADAGPGAQTSEDARLAHEPPSDGTVREARIWLRGKPYRLTLGLRGLLRYLLLNQGVSEERVIKHFGLSGASHLHKRLANLRQRLSIEMKKSGWRLKLRAEDTRLYHEWLEAR
jgi:hypothetical protein